MGGGGRSSRWGRTRMKVTVVGEPTTGVMGIDRVDHTSVVRVYLPGAVVTGPVDPGERTVAGLMPP